MHFTVPSDLGLGLGPQGDLSHVVIGVTVSNKESYREVTANLSVNGECVDTVTATSKTQGAHRRLNNTLFA